jgi:hypothetical protein
MRLEDAGGDNDDELSVGAGSGGGGVEGDVAVANEAAAVAVANEAVAVMDDAGGPPLLPDELIDTNIVFPAAAGGVDNDTDVSELAIRHGLLSGSDLSNAPVAESIPPCTMPGKRPGGVTGSGRDVEMAVGGFLVEGGVDARAFDGKGQFHEVDRLREGADDLV